MVMDEAVIVIMLKDKESGFLEKELGCYKVQDLFYLIALDALDPYQIMYLFKFGEHMPENYQCVLKLCEW